MALGMDTRQDARGRPPQPRRKRRLKHGLLEKQAKAPKRIVLAAPLEVVVQGGGAFFQQVRQGEAVVDVPVAQDRAPGFRHVGEHVHHAVIGGLYGASGQKHRIGQKFVGQAGAVVRRGRKERAVQAFGQRRGLHAAVLTEHDGGGDAAEVDGDGRGGLVTQKAAGRVVEQRAQRERAAPERHKGRKAVHAGVAPCEAGGGAQLALRPAPGAQGPYLHALRAVGMDEIALPQAGRKAHIGPIRPRRGPPRRAAQRPRRFAARRSGHRCGGR